MKKFLLLTVLLVALVALAACGGGSNNDDSGTATPGGNEPAANVTTPGNDGATGDVAQPAASALPPLTTEPVHLTFGTWHDIYQNQFLADRFTERHPNITVEVVYVPLYGHTDTLTAMAAARDLPDIFGFLDLSAPVNNGWFYDFSEFWFNDPDVNVYYLESLRGAGVIDGRAVMMVEGFLPCVVFVDRSVFERANVPMPRFNWTYEEMVALIPELTRPDLGIFGFYNFIGPITYAPIVLTDALSEFGWDGQNYNMGIWADTLMQMNEWQQLGMRAAAGTDEWEALTGDRYLWPGVSGRIGMQMDAWWTLNNIYSQYHYRFERGLDMIPYVVPRGANAQTNRKPAFLDFAGISAAVSHPREAYEVLKWFSFNPDAWMYRIYNFEHQLNAYGDRFYRVPNRMPVTTVDAVWDAYRLLMPDVDGDAFLSDAFDALMRYIREPVPLGSRGILGFDAWLHEVYFNGEFNGVIGIYAAVAEGAINAHDAVPYLEARGRQFFEATLTNFRAIYGPPPER